MQGMYFLMRKNSMILFLFPFYFDAAFAAASLAPEPA